MSDLQRMAGLYRKILLFKLAALAVVVAVYPEDFSLLGDPISWLGKTGSGQGLAFYTSFWLFFAALLVNIFSWNQIFSLLARHPAWERPLVRTSCRAVLAGFVLMLFPCDRFDPIHSTGGTRLGLGMWMISTMMLVRMKGEIKASLGCLLHLVLHSAALFCIINFVLNTDLKGFSQRPVILAVVFVTNVCLHIQLRSLLKPGRQASNRGVLLLR